MALVIQIVLAVVVLLALVATYLSSKNWHWSQVVLGLFLFLSAVGYAILGADTLRIHRNLRANIEKNQNEIASFQLRNTALLHGTNDRSLMRKALPADSKQHELSQDDSTEPIPGIHELEHRMHLVTRLRGKVWRGVGPAGPLADNGQIEVQIPNPKPHNLTPDSIVYAFESGNPSTTDGSEGAQYLGEFRVVSTSENGAILTPTIHLNQRTGERLARSQGPWNLYETMPVDQHKLFAGLPEEQLRQWFPESSVQEYLRDGTPATEDDDPWHIAWFDAEGNRVGPEAIDTAKNTPKYDRPLRDYALFMSELARERVEQIADSKALIEDNKKLQTALADAKQLGKLRQQQQQLIKQDLAGMISDRDAIQELLVNIQNLLAQINSTLDQTLASNAQQAKQYAANQMALKHQIDSLTPPSDDNSLLPAP